MKRTYKKPLIEIKEYNLEETITTSSLLNNLFGKDILEDKDAVNWDWVD